MRLRLADMNQTTTMTEPAEFITCPHCCGNGKLPLPKPYARTLNCLRSLGTGTALVEIARLKSASNAAWENFEALRAAALSAAEEHPIEKGAAQQ